ncbi:MAG TPA: hypothetical protein VGO87_00180, partial [Acidimicrobiia bacterium]
MTLTRLTAASVAAIAAIAAVTIGPAALQSTGSQVAAATRHRVLRPVAVRRSAARPVRPAAKEQTPASPARLQQAEAIADSSGWDWRRAGVVIHAAFHPQACCHWGIYDPSDSSLWIGPTAFADSGRLRYTVLHELGHAWQWHSGHLDQLAADMAPWGHRGMGGLEAGADCISVLWGASPKAGHYWACPPTAAGVVARRLAGD